MNGGSSLATLQSIEVAGLAGSSGKKKIQFREDTTVLYGLNGSGKTSLLKILDSVMSGDPIILFRIPFMSAEVRLLEDGIEYTCTVSKEQILSDDAYTEFIRSGFDERYMSPMHRDRLLRRTRSRNFGWKVTPDRPVEDGFRYRYLPTSRLTSAVEREVSTSRNELTEAFYDKIFARKIEGIWEQYSRQELIAERVIQQEGLADIFSTVLNASDLSSKDVEYTEDADQAYEALMKFFREQQLRVKNPRTQFLRSYKKDPLLRNVVAKITNVEQRVAEAQAPSRKIESLISSLYIGGKEVKLGRSITIMGKESKAIPIELLSSGEKQVLLIMLETLAARSDLIVIDEPELSMHVDWQNALVRSMRAVNEDGQIVLATHSPEVLAGVPKRCVQEL